MATLEEKKDLFKARRDTELSVEFDDLYDIVYDLVDKVADLEQQIGEIKESL